MEFSISNETDLTKTNEKFLNDQVELNEHESRIVDYLENETALPGPTLDWLLSKFWTKEPYKSKGFVLDGFPQTVDDLQFLIDNQYLVDFVLNFDCEQEEVIARLLPKRIELWTNRINKQKENKQKLKEWKLAKKVLKLLLIIMQIIMLSQKKFLLKLSK